MVANLLLQRISIGSTIAGTAKTVAFTLVPPFIAELWPSGGESLGEIQWINDTMGEEVDAEKGYVGLATGVAGTSMILSVWSLIAHRS